MVTGFDLLGNEMYNQHLRVPAIITGATENHIFKNVKQLRNFCNESVPEDD